MKQVKVTMRGFEYIDFTDWNNQECRLAQSSLMGLETGGASAIHLGRPGRHLMHLDRRQVKELIDTLQHWLDTGSFVDVANA